MDHELTIPKIKRTLRPLVAKVHRINDLYRRAPALLRFVVPVNSDIHLKQISTLVLPPNALQRLETLKPYIDPELYVEYRDLYIIFQSTVVSLIKGHSYSQNQDLVHGSLSTLCCLSLGKLIAVGSKTSYFKLNQAILFENEATSDDVPDDIEDWFSMEPYHVFGKYTFYLLMGYILHLMVFNANTLYLLIPVLLEWLLEQHEKTQLPMYHNLHLHLFRQYWMYSSLDYRDGAWDHHDTYWVLYEIRYWDSLFHRLNISDTYYLDHFKLNQKVDFMHIKHIMVLLQQHPQHQDTTEILALAARQILGHCTGSRHSTSLELASRYKETLTTLIQVCQTWLSFRFESNQMVFDSLLPGNELIFASFTHCSRYIWKMSYRLFKQQGLDSFLILCSESEKVMKILLLLKSYFLDIEAEYIPQDSETHQLGNCIISWFTDTARGETSETTESILNVQLNEFLWWLKDVGGGNLARYLFRSYYNDVIFELEVEDFYEKLVGNEDEDMGYY